MPQKTLCTWFFFGDSLTLGVNDHAMPGGWVSRLALLGKDAGLYPYPPATFYNLGARRHSTASVAARWENELQARQLPDADIRLAFCVGVVDMAGPAGATPGTLENACACLEGMLASAKKAATTLLVCPPPVANAETCARIGELCSRQERICADLAIPCVNIHRQLADSSDYMGDLADGLHPGPKGSAVMAGLLFAQDSMKRFLAANPA